MLIKPLNLIIVYLLTIVNLLILLLPFAAILYLLVQLNQDLILNKILEVNFNAILIFLIFIISFLMIIYLFFDFIFGFSVSSSLKGCKNYSRLKDYRYLKKIFEQVQERFGRTDVQLFISNSGEINAFAVGSFGKRVIVLTQGLINHTSHNSKDKKELLLMLRSIMGHEMSHLVNKDYLPTLLIIINQKATNLVSRVLELMIRIPLTILGYMRIRSRIIFDIMMFVYSAVNKIVIFFNAKVIYNLYEFIRKFISRSIEYRCDKQAAQAFGGRNMGNALSLFGESGYFTLFSTHPDTKSRINKVNNIERKNKVIRPLISSTISNYLSLMVLIIICSSSAKFSKADIFFREYLVENHEYLYAQMLLIFEWIKYGFSLVKNLI
jgi:Zn-dependent protease with chaperone function